jgi:hypothetical protein
VIGAVGTAGDESHGTPIRSGPSKEIALQLFGADYLFWPPAADQPEVIEML